MSGNSRNPSTPAIELGLQLKAERRRARQGRPRGYAKTEIPKNIVTDRTLLDIEEGRKRTVKRGFVRDICAFYQTAPDLIENLVSLADATYMDDWTAAYSGAVDKDGWLYLQREDRATTLMFHNSTSIPSILQPPSYVEMIRRTTKVNFGQGDIDWDQARRFRESRQRRWIESRRRTVCLIGETAFRVDIGDGASEELRRHVLKLAQLPFADIRVIPYAAGRYDLMGWEVSLLEFGNGEEPIVRVESPRGAGLFAANSGKGPFFRQAFDLAKEFSIPVKEHLT